MCTAASLLLFLLVVARVCDYRSEPYCSPIAVKPHHLTASESALCSCSRDGFASGSVPGTTLSGLWWDAETPLTEYLFILLSIFFFLDRKLHPLSFQEYKICILCLRFLKLGEAANGSRGRAVWRKKSEG